MGVVAVATGTTTGGIRTGTDVRTSAASSHDDGGVRGGGGGGDGGAGGDGRWG